MIEDLNCCVFAVHSPAPAILGCLFDPVCFRSQCLCFQVGIQQCPDKSTCPDGSTCCAQSDGTYACCPFPKVSTLTQARIHDFGQGGPAEF